MMPSHWFAGDLSLRPATTDTDAGIVNNLSVGTTVRSGDSVIVYNVFSIFEFNL